MDSPTSGSLGEGVCFHFRQLIPRFSQVTRKWVDDFARCVEV